MVNVTSLAEEDDGESESEQVKPGNKEVESEFPSTPGIVTCSSVNPVVDGAENADMAVELNEDNGEIDSVLEEEGYAALGIERGVTTESHPLTVLRSSKEGVEELTAQQLDDESLTEVMRNGKEQKDGFSFNKDGLLMHAKISDLGKLNVRIVVPKCRREGVLDSTHRGLAGYYFSEKKIFLSISVHF